MVGGDPESSCGHGLERTGSVALDPRDAPAHLPRNPSAPPASADILTPAEEARPDWPSLARRQRSSTGGSARIHSSNRVWLRQPRCPGQEGVIRLQASATSALRSPGVAPRARAQAMARPIACSVSRWEKSGGAGHQSRSAPATTSSVVENEPPTSECATKRTLSGAEAASNTGLQVLPHAKRPRYGPG